MTKTTTKASKPKGKAAAKETTAAADNEQSDFINSLWADQDVVEELEDYMASMEVGSSPARQCITLAKVTYMLQFTMKAAKRPA
jgi:hypothetical protein